MPCDENFPFLVGVDVARMVEEGIEVICVTGPSDGDGTRVFTGDDHTPRVEKFLGTAKAWFGSADTCMKCGEKSVTHASLYDWDEVVFLARSHPWLFNAADRNEIARAARCGIKALQEVIMICVAKEPIDSINHERTITIGHDQNKRKAAILHEGDDPEDVIRTCREKELFLTRGEEELLFRVIFPGEKASGHFSADQIRERLRPQS